MQKSANLFDSSGNLVSLGKKLGAGGEGAVYEIASNRNQLVAKVYHHALTPGKEKKISVMSALQDTALTTISTWPVGTLHMGRSGPVRGLLMPKMVGYKPVHILYGPAHRKAEFPSADWAFLIQAARNTAAAIATIHHRGHVVGDINEGNVVVSASALVKLIDCDSFQIRHGQQLFGCEVGVAHFTPPELQGKTFKDVIRTANHDNFGLAVLCFHLLFMGRHPFAGRYEGSGEMSIERAIREFRFAYGASAHTKKMGPPPNALPLHAVSPELAQLFERAFDQNGVFGSRPTALQWVGALEHLKTNLVICSRVNAHKYHRGVGRCPWCILEGLSGVTFFVGSTAAVEVPQFDALSIWRQIEAVGSPGPATPPKPQRQPSPAPPPDALKGFYAFKRMFRTKAYLQEWGRREQALADALSKFNTLMVVWQEQAGEQRFTAKHQELRSMYTTYKALIEQFKQAKEQLAANARAIQLQRYLEQYYIDQARITGIGPTRKAALASFGIETAADVSRRAILAIPSFGETLAYELLKWRTGLERSFVFNPQRGIHSGDVTRLQQQVYQRLKGIEQAMLSGLEELKTLKQEILYKRTALSAELTRAEMALAQARADMTVL